MRQICDSTQLVKQEDPPPPAEVSEGGVAPGPQSKLTAEERRALVERLGELIAAGGLDECPICMDDVLTPVITPCAHVFCRCLPPPLSLCASREGGKKDSMPVMCSTTTFAVQQNKGLARFGHGSRISEFAGLSGILYRTNQACW